MVNNIVLHNDIKNIYKNVDPLLLLHEAVKTEDVPMINILLKYGVNINYLDEAYKSPLYYAVKQQNFAIASMLVKAGAKTHPENSVNVIIEAICMNDLELVSLFLKNGTTIDFDINAEFVTKLIRIPSILSEPKVVLTLLKKFGTKINYYPSNHEPLLHLAVKSQNANVVKMILQLCKDVNARYCGDKTALHIATVLPNARIVKLLLTYGADVNASDDEGNYPLHNAVKFGPSESIVFLLNFNADINAENKSKMTTLDISANNGLITEKTVILIHHLIKLMSLNMYVSRKNIGQLVLINERKKQVLVNGNYGWKMPQLCYNKKIFLDIAHKCEKEIMWMKCHMISKTNKTSVYDILVQPLNKIATYFRNKEFLDDVVNKNLESYFPIFNSMIKRKTQLGIQKMIFYNYGHGLLRLLLDQIAVLPTDCTWIIFSYFNDEDIQFLIDNYI